MRTMLDLFCGRGGWTNAFLERGWECIGVDIEPQLEYRGKFVQADIMKLEPWDLNALIWPRSFDFICASSPCQQFSYHGMKMFFPNPAEPILGLQLFNHTRYLCESLHVPYVMENVRAAQYFVGLAKHHCGPFYLWGNSVPPLMPQNIRKNSHLVGWDRDTGKRLMRGGRCFSSRSKQRKEWTATIAMIPPMLANCVADYAERLQQ